MAGRKIALSFFLLGALSNAAWAEPLDLSQATERALQNNPSLAQAKEQIAESRARKSLNYSALFPNVSLSAARQYRKDAVANRSANLPFGGEPYNQYNVGLNAVQPLFVWGSFAAVRKAELDRQIRERELEMAEREVTSKVISAYYKVILQESVLRLLSEEEKVLGESLSTSQSRMRTGRGQLIDVLQVKTQVALLKPKIASAKADLESAASELALIMGETEKSRFELKGRLPSLRIKDVEPKLNLKEFRLPEIDRILLSQEQLDEERSITFGKDLPSLKLVADYDFMNYTKSELFDGASKSWQVALMLNVPLFSGLSSVFERRAIASQESQLEFQKRDLGNKLSLQQIRARKALEAAESSLASAEEAADLSNQSIAEARRTYRLALIDFLQFLQVEQSNIEAITSLNNLKFKSIEAYRDYFVASGQPLSLLVNLLSQAEKK